MAHMSDVERAIWEGDLDKLQELAPCGCCCGEHYFRHCQARVWGGCRGNHDDVEEAEWQRFYAEVECPTRPFTA
jgi:hypothetical protein